MNNSFTEIYLEFMSYTLGLLNDLNLLFQTESPLLHKLQPETERLLKHLFPNFVDPSFVRENSNNLSLEKCRNHFVPLEKVYVGVAASESIVKLRNANVSEAEINGFLLSCLNFYTELVAQINKKFKFNDPIFKLTSVVNPAEAQKLKSNSLAPVCNRFTILKFFVDIQQLDNECRDHAFLDFKNLGLDLDLHVENYWKKVFQLKNATGIFLFPNL